jgi:hypothetical protein
MARTTRSATTSRRWTLKGSILSDAAGAYGGSVANPFYQKVNRVSAANRPTTRECHTCRKSFMLGGRGFVAAAEGTTFEQDAYIMGLVHGARARQGHRRKRVATSPAPSCVPAASAKFVAGLFARRCRRRVDGGTRPRERRPLRATSVTRPEEEGAERVPPRDAEGFFRSRGRLLDSFADCFGDPDDE